MLSVDLLGLEAKVLMAYSDKIYISGLGQHKLKYTSKVLKAAHLPHAPTTSIPRPGVHAYVILNKPFPALRTVPSILSFCRWRPQSFLKSSLGMREMSADSCFHFNSTHSSLSSLQPSTVPSKQQESKICSLSK